MASLIPILEFAYRLGFASLYDWQCRILLRYEAGEPVAAACANYTGKTSVIFPICALWTLYNFPNARLMYMSATYDQVCNQFFSGLKRFSDHRYFAGWQWLESEVRTRDGGFLFGRASDVGGHVEGIHDQRGSVAGLLIDEAKTIRDENTGYAEPVSCDVPIVCELDWAGGWGFLPDLHDEGAFMARVPCAF